MIIMNLTDSHVAALVSFVRDIRREQLRELTAHELDAVRNTFFRVLKSENARCRICESDGRIVGYLAMHLVEFAMLLGCEAYVTELFVGKDDRGRGAGTLLLDDAERICRDAGCIRIMLNNPRHYDSYMRSYYQKHGFEERTGFANFVKQLR